MMYASLGQCFLKLNAKYGQGILIILTFNGNEISMKELNSEIRNYGLVPVMANFNNKWVVHEYI